MNEMIAKLANGIEGKLLSAPWGLYLGSTVTVETIDGEKTGYLAELYCTAS